MKTFIAITLLVAFSAVVMCDPPNPETRKHMEDCVKENNISPKEFQDFMEGKVTEPSEGLKCSSLCVMTKEGIMDASGSFKADAAKAKMPDDDKFVAAVDNCKSQKGSSPCDTAMKITQCMLKHKPSM